MVVVEYTGDVSVSTQVMSQSPDIIIDPLAYSTAPN